MAKKQRCYCRLDIFITHYTTFPRTFEFSCAKPLGEIVDYGIRIEFQAQGSPHAHCVLWVNNAPQFEVDHNNVVCDFTDKYVSCEIPKNVSKYSSYVPTAQAFLILQKT